MDKNDILEILEYQFGKDIKNEFEKHDFEIKKSKSRRIEIIVNKKPILYLNPKFFLFNFGIEFGKLLKKYKKFYVKVSSEFLKDIRDKKNVIRKNVIEFSKDFRFGDDIIILDEKDNLIAIAKAKINSYEISNSNYGIVARIKKFI
ncbi:MAG: PUA domain-containing protein [Candidatus Aenigmatarchaeota archaeon]